MTQEVSEDAVGRRVCCDGERGTVRYVGTVPPTAGTSLSCLILAFITVTLSVYNKLQFEVSSQRFLCLYKCRFVVRSGVG